MREDFNYLFQYLEKENIPIDKSEFLFQVQSHPDYPTLLSIVDTLNFFGIKNNVIRVDSNSIESLPNLFVTFLDETSQLYLIEYINNSYKYIVDNKKKYLNILSLKKKWNGIVLLIEKSTYEVTKKDRSSKYSLLYPTICFFLFLIILYLKKTDLRSSLFFVFSTFGLLFSIASLKDLFEGKSKLLNSFCNISTSSSCSTIINSEKWKIFKHINLSDISVVFYASQLIGLFSFIILNELSDFYLIQKTLLLIAFPVILLSIYYQKFIEKKWCPICLVISLILIIEFIYIFYFIEIVKWFSSQSIFFFSFIFFFVSFSWSIIKKNIKNLQELKMIHIKGNRFMRDYQIFKNSLLSTPRIELPDSPILLGNKKANIEITIITNPFCAYCKTAHQILEKILINKYENVKIKIIINTEINNQTEERKLFFRTLMSIYVENGEKKFNEVFSDWFNNQDISNWLEKHETNCNFEKIDSIYEGVNLWCAENNYSFTPVIFINGFLYPRTHYREDLEFFINDLLEDEI